MQVITVCEAPIVIIRIDARRVDSLNLFPQSSNTPNTTYEKHTKIANKNLPPDPPRE